MALTDSKSRNLKPHIETDEGRRHMEVMSGGAKLWRLRYRIGGRSSKPEKVVSGECPGFTWWRLTHSGEAVRFL